MTITAIVKRKRQKRYDVYLDGVFFATLSDDAILTHRIKVGVEVDKRQFATVVALGERQDAVNDLLASLSRRAHTVRTAKDKLKERGFSHDAIAYAIEKMQDYGYIDDKQYAQDYIEQFRATRSALRIRRDLMQKGIASSIVDEMLASQDESEACYRSLQRKARGKEWSDESKLKVMRSLVSQGFSFDTVRSCVARFEKEMGSVD